MEKALEVRDLKKYYGRSRPSTGFLSTALGVKFLLCSGQRSRKTTIVEILEGLREADSGEIVFLRSPAAGSAVQKKSGLGLSYSRQTSYAASRCGKCWRCSLLSTVER